MCLRVQVLRFQSAGQVSQKPSQNLEQMETAAREGVFDPLFATTDKFNFEVVTLYTSGARHIYTNNPITKPEDLKGYKIRVQDSDT